MLRADGKMHWGHAWLFKLVRCGQGDVGVSGLGLLLLLKSSPFGSKAMWVITSGVLAFALFLCLRESTYMRHRNFI